MPKPATQTRPRYQLGDIVEVPIVYDERTGQKFRPAVIVAINGPTVIVRPLYTNPGLNRSALVKRTIYNELDHDSYLSTRLHHVRTADIRRKFGFLDDDLDPFGDFSTAA